MQVVCGAPNARTGMKSVFSPVGTFIPGKNLTLAKGVIRGVESHGMLCSAAELSSPTITTASSSCPTTRRSSIFTVSIVARPASPFRRRFSHRPIRVETTSRNSTPP